MVGPAPFSYPVATSAQRYPSSKHPSEFIDPRTTVRTLGPLEEDNKTGMQTGYVNLLNVVVYLA